VYGVQAAMRLRTEEAAVRAEPLLATSVGRVRWAMSHVTIALLGTATLLVAGGLSAGAAQAFHTSDVADVGRVLAGALVQLPATWVLVGIVVAAFGFAPRQIGLGWAALVAFLLIGEIGPLFELRQWVLEFTAEPLLWLTAVAVALTVAGLARFRGRDVG
jgi:ABC-2 type transport system permease protein